MNSIVSVLLLVALVGAVWANVDIPMKTRLCLEQANINAPNVWISPKVEKICANKTGSVDKNTQAYLSYECTDYKERAYLAYIDSDCKEETAEIIKKDEYDIVRDYFKLDRLVNITKCCDRLVPTDETEIDTE